MHLMVLGERKPIVDPVLRKWLDEFSNVRTKKNYCSILRKFKACLGIKDLGEYLRSELDAIGDLKRFSSCLRGRPSKTVHSYVSGVRVFFLDHNVDLPETDLRKMRRRGFVPKRNRALTRDKKPSKVLLRKILNYADIKLRALVLFLVSGGGRVGETLKLCVGDFDFVADPPRVHVRDEITKGGAGGRTVYFSYEARDALRDWIRVKGRLRKRSGELYGGDVVFPFSYKTAHYMWNRACDKAGCNERDDRTNRRVYHIHCLRKFFRSNVGLDLDVVHALMGHVEYLDDAYLRLEEKGEVAKQYLGCMGNVSVYEVVDSALRERTEAVEEENVLMKREMDSMKQELAEIKAAIGKRTEWDKK